MQAQEIEHYLAELGAALQNQGIIKPKSFRSLSPARCTIGRSRNHPERAERAVRI
jgi:hypothetical protein